MNAIIEIKKLPHRGDLPLPQYETEGAAGMDLHAALSQTMTLAPLQRALIPTGIAMALSEGYEAQIRPRSGLAAKFGVTVLNTPGTIDSDYRGEVKIILINLGDEDFTIQHGERVAQMVIAPVTQAKLVEVDELNETKRGADGFGSTGR